MCNFQSTLELECIVHVYRKTICRLGSSSVNILTSTTPAHRHTRYAPQYCRFVKAKNTVASIRMTGYDDIGIA